MTDSIPTTKSRQCAVAACERKVVAKGLCDTHRKRRDQGRPLGPPIRPCFVGMTEVERFWSHVDIRGPDECWPWHPMPYEASYGCLYLDDGTTEGAHRFAWYLANGPIPDGLWVLHHCDFKPCCNERHLFLGTNLDNIADKVTKGRQRGAWPGERHHNAKLTVLQVGEIRTRLSGENIVSLAKEFGVSVSAIGLIKRGKNWASV